MNEPRKSGEPARNRLHLTERAPDVDDLYWLLREARREPGCILEQPWVHQSSGTVFILTLFCDKVRGEPHWTLYRGDGPDSVQVWNYQNMEVEFISEMMLLSAEEAASAPPPSPFTAQSPWYGDAAARAPAQPNVPLGEILLRAGKISEPTLEAALLVQERVREGKLPPAEAAELLKDIESREQAKVAQPDSTAGEQQWDPPPAPANPAHARASASAPPPSPAQTPPKERSPESGDVAPAASGASAPAQAPPDLASSSGAPPPAREERRLPPLDHETSAAVLELLTQAGLLFEAQIEQFREEQFAGAPATPTAILNSLAQSGMVSRHAQEAALQCVRAMKNRRMKLEQAIMAVHYCDRGRCSLTDAIYMLGWEISLS